MMRTKLVTPTKLAWVGILIVIILGLLFLPALRKRISEKAPKISNTRSQSGEQATSRGAPLGMAPATVLPQTTEAGRQYHVVIFHVIDAKTGRGIEGATLHVGTTAANDVTPLGGDLVTDQDGRCPVEVTFPKAYAAAVSVRADGYVSRRLFFRSEEDLLPEYTFKLEKGPTIGGYVRGEEGKPIDDVKITIRASNSLTLSPKLGDREQPTPSLLAKTDASGRWSCNEILPEPLRIQLSLAHPEHVPCDYWTDPSYEGPGRTIQNVAMSELKSGKAVLIMKYGLLVAGIVEDASGRAIEGATIDLFASALPLSGSVSTLSTSQDGRFAFTDAKPGAATLRVRARGFATESKRIEVVPGLPEIEFRLRKGQIVRGRVVDDDGRPIARAQIRTLQPLDSDEGWMDDTDNEGRFSWDSAPVTALIYNVYAHGFKSLDPLVLEPGKDHEITLHRLLVMRVSGKVVDAQTQMAIDKFTVAAISSSLSVPAAFVEGVSGEFSLAVNELFPKYVIRVEAAGYRTDNSRSLDFREGEQYLEFSLVRGDGPSGIVKLPNGEAVAGASVFLCGGNVTNLNFINPGEKAPAAPMMTGLKSVRSGQGGSLYYAAATTDEAGQFTFSSMPEAHTAIATHEKGFVAVTVEQLLASHTLTLDPWGRIEGTLKVRTKPGANQRVTLRTLNYDLVSRPPGILVQLMAQTDAEGQFVFPTVPPGEYLVAHPSGAEESQATSVVVRSGETVLVKLGGIGRPIIGQIVVIGTDSPIDWRLVRPTLSLKVPEIRMPDRSDRAAYRAWRQTEEGKNSLRSQHVYAVAVAEDGSFRAEDIPAGAYVLSVSVIVRDPSRPTQPSHAEATREFVVPEMRGGRSDTPLDLGAITVQVK
jgi:5-hydroxyisourate hydrolase-like protein (transthyretin family)